jgi:SAM-dependent methyltransferase
MNVPLPTAEIGRRSHASKHVAGRKRKAKKIAALIETQRGLAGCDILEVGAGAGVISHLLAELATEHGSVTAVDVADERVVFEGYRFVEIKDTRLPFPDASFDIAVSNHVIEHVGALADQQHHVHEIYRVLRPGGLVYLAAPNRWALLEPHYRLPLLSWLPRPAANAYLRITGKGRAYDCQPRGPRRLAALLTAAGFKVLNRCPAAVKLTAQQNNRSRLVRLVAMAPDRLLLYFTGLMPSLIYIAHKEAAEP